MVPVIRLSYSRALNSSACSTCCSLAAMWEAYSLASAWLMLLWSMPSKMACRQLTLSIAFQTVLTHSTRSLSLSITGLVSHAFSRWGNNNSDILALDPVCFLRHAAPTAPADQDAGKQIHCILLGRSPVSSLRIRWTSSKILLGNQRLMGIRNANPFRGCRCSICLIL